MPDLGRFGKIDPRSQYTHESYSYVWNNPINFWDPTGMEGESASSDSGGSGGAEATNGGDGEEGGFGGLAQGGPGKGKGGNPEKEKATLIEEVVITVYKPIKVAATAAVSFTVTTSEAIFASVSSAINSAGASLAVGLRWSLLTLPLILNGDTPRPENDIFIPPPPYYKSDKDDDKDSNCVEVPKEGDNSEYTDKTGKRTVNNRETDVSKGEFEDNLEKSGYEKTKTSDDGKSTTYSNGKNSYNLRNDKRGNPTADFKRGPSGKGETVLKIRLKP